MKKLFFTFAAIAALSMMAFHANAQVKIGNNPNTINAGSILELESDSLGVLFPRVNIQDLATWAPLKGDSIEGTTVYNKNTTTGKGFYFWDNTKWVKMSGMSENNWSLGGNKLTDKAFIGTTNDARDIIFRFNRYRAAGILSSYNEGSRSSNTSFGVYALQYQVDISYQNNSYTANSNSAFGMEALRKLQTGSNNVAVGKSAGAYLVSGSNNTFLGNTSAVYANNAHSNVAVGYSTFHEVNHVNPNNYTLSRSIAIGYSAGDALISGDNNIFIGTETKPNISLYGSNQINIGNTIFGYNKKIGIGPKYNAVISWSSSYPSTTRYIIDTPGLIPTEQLEVDGSIKLLKINDANYTSSTATDKIVVADTDGVLKTKDASKMVFTNLPEYPNDTDADNDASLPSGSLYKLTGSGRLVFVKP